MIYLYKYNHILTKMEGKETKEGLTDYRKKITDRLRKRNPDSAYETDDDLLAGVDGEFDMMDSDYADLNNNVTALTGMFNSDPRSAAFLVDWKKGEDPVVGLIRRFGTDMVQRLDDPDIAEQVSDANKQYLERIQKSKELDEEYTKNIAQTISDIDKLQSEEGISDDEIDEVWEFLKGVVEDGIVGKFSIDTIRMAMKAINHDNDVDIANREGEVRGRNQKITEKLRNREKSDGLGNIEGSNTAVQKKKPQNIFEMARDAM